MFAQPVFVKQNVQQWINQAVSRWTLPSQTLPNLTERIGCRKIASHSYLGLQKVALNQIRGTASEARSQDFDTNFRLINLHNRPRLESVQQARRRSTLPPISVVAVNGEYFVQDGHHRVSVWRACAEETIMAHVTVLELA